MATVVLVIVWNADPLLDHCRRREMMRDHMQVVHLDGLWLGAADIPHGGMWKRGSLMKMIDVLLKQAGTDLVFMRWERVADNLEFDDDGVRVRVSVFCVRVRVLFHWCPNL